MADRSVVVRLRADIAQYEAAMKRAKATTTEFGREVTGRGKTAKADVEAVGRSALIMGGAMAIGLGKGIQVAMGFEKQMSGVKAVSGATAAEMDKLSDAAVAAGASTKLAGVTASDAAKAEAELVKAGVSVADVLGGALMGSLTLAAAGQIDFANAATIAAQAMNIFDLKGGAVTHIADVLAAAANKSASDVAGLGDALRQGGLIAAQTGLSLEETVAALAVFADNALIGSDAGTSLKTMLQRLTPVSAEAAGLMEDLGFSAFDAQGNFVGLQGLADELQTSMAGMTVEQRALTMATLFGSDAVRGANVLYEEGAEGIREYEEAVDDAGAAARMAAIQNDNLAGDVEALGGAIESALIENGSKANDVLRAMTQQATGLVAGFSSMPDLLQTAGLGFGVIVTAGTLAVGVLGTLAPKAIAAKAALVGMGSGAAFLGNNLGNIAKGLTVLGAGFAVFAQWQSMMARAAASGREFAESLRPQVFDFSGYEDLRDKIFVVGEEIDSLTGKSGSLNPLNFDSNAEFRAAAEELGVYYQELSQIRALAMDLAPVLGISKDAAVEFVTAQQAAGVDILAADYDGLKGSLTKTFGEMTTGTAASHVLEGSMNTLGSEVASVEDQIKAFGDSLDALFNQMFGIEAAEDAFQSSLNELPDVLKEASKAGLNLNDTLSSQSDEAITVRGHMRGMIADASDMIAEWQEQGITGEALAGKIYLLSQSFRDQAIAAGVPVPVVDHYLGLLDKIPGTKNTSFSADTAAALEDLAALSQAISGIPSRFGVSVTTTGNGFLGGNLQLGGATGGSVPTGLTPIYRAAGGPMGTDTIPMWGSHGEFMQQKSAVDRYGLAFMESVNAGTYSPATGGVTVINQVTVSAGNIVGDHRELVRVVQQGMDEASRLTAGAR